MKKALIISIGVILISAIFLAIKITTPNKFSVFPSKGDDIQVHGLTKIGKLKISNEDRSSFQTFNNEQCGFEFVYPAGWFVYGVCPEWVVLWDAEIVEIVKEIFNVGQVTIDHFNHIPGNIGISMESKEVDQSLEEIGQHRQYKEALDEFSVDNRRALLYKDYRDVDTLYGTMETRIVLVDNGKNTISFSADIFYEDTLFEILDSFNFIDTTI